MFVGIARIVLQIPGSRSLKDRRRVIKSLKDRMRAKLPVSVAEVGELEQLQIANVGVAVISNESERCDEIISAAVGMARVLPDAVLADVKTEVVPFGFGGRSLSGGIERALEAEQPAFEMPEEWKRS
ncbi:MAG TPA: DUF503 domain-containing protein [Polyangiaceae bacterium]|nr:DUF503 domain-containing protein [Polyangiaceae bacterium]